MPLDFSSNCRHCSSRGAIWRAVISQSSGCCQISCKVCRNPPSCCSSTVMERTLEESDPLLDCDMEIGSKLKESVPKHARSMQWKPLHILWPLRINMHRVGPA